MFIWNKDYAEISQDLPVKAFVDAYEYINTSLICKNKYFMFGCLSRMSVR